MSPSEPQNVVLLTNWLDDDPVFWGGVSPYLEILQSILPNDSKIKVVSLSNKLFWVKSSSINPQVSHLRFPTGRARATKLLYLMARMLYLIIYINTKRIQVIHAFCTPAGSIGLALKLFTMRKLVVDSFEPHADSMVEIGHWKSSGLRNMLLSNAEKLQLKYADALIGVSKVSGQYFARRYGIIRPDMLYRPCSLDFNKFKVSDQKQKDEIRKTRGIPLHKTIGVYAGKFGGIYYAEEFFDFLQSLLLQVNQNFFFLILTTSDHNACRMMARNAGIPDSCIMIERSLHDEIGSWLTLADFGLCPVRSIDSKRYCSPIKLGEYWASGLPAVLSERVGDECVFIEQFDLGITLNFECPGTFRAGGEKLLNVLKKADYDSAVERRRKCNTLRGRPIVADAYLNAYEITQ